MKITLKVWRQKNSSSKGNFETYQLPHVSEDMSFLEMFDVLNEQLVSENKEPVAFDHDCREGICGMCSMYINGRAHGPQQGTTTCQLHMRHFKDGDTITVEPWRAQSFPVLKDLMVDRGAFDRIIASGGYISVNTGVAACKNSSAMLFVSAKVSQLSLLPQGKPEKNRRVLDMVAQMDKEGFGSCTNTGACEAECPKEISVMNIATLNREFLSASMISQE